MPPVVPGKVIPRKTTKRSYLVQVGAQPGVNGDFSMKCKGLKHLGNLLATLCADGVVARVSIVKETV